MITTLRLVTQSALLQKQRSVTLLNGLAGAGQVVEAARLQAIAASLSAVDAAADRAAAELSADVAAAAGKVFPTAADGVAGGTGVAAGGYYWVPSADSAETLMLYRNVAGVATDTGKRQPSAAGIDGRIRRQEYRGWLSVVTSSDGKLLQGVSKAGRVIWGVGGDILARIEATEATAGAFKVLSGSRSFLAYIRDSTGKMPFAITRAGRTLLMGRDVLAEVDAAAGKVDALLTNPALVSKFIAPSKDLTLLGDSQINGAGPVPWRTQIVPLISSRNYRNLAIGGQTSTQIAARFGAVATFLTVSGNSIPTSGAVAVTECARLKDDGTLDTAFAPITNQGSNTLLGVLYGVPGTLTRDVGTGAYSFTRSSAGSAVACPARTPFKPTWADYELNTLVIGLGRNNISDLVTVKRDTLACSAAQRSIEKRQIILTVTNGGSITPGVPTNEGVGTATGDAVVALELWAEATFTGPGFAVVNVRKLLMQHGDGSADDLADIAAGTVPRSLRIDAVHYSEAAHGIIAARIASIINANGW